jgi:hypothetical protein
MVLCYQNPTLWSGETKVRLMKWFGDTVMVQQDQSFSSGMASWSYSRNDLATPFST